MPSLPASERRAAAERRALAERFVAAVPMLRRRVEAALAPGAPEGLSSVTLHQMEALRCLSSGDGITMHGLARAQNVGLSSATALADRLERQGLAERVADPGDRRVVRLVLTDRAAELVDRYCRAKREAAVTVLGGLDDDEARTLVHLLEKVAGLTAAEAGGDD